MITKNIEKTDKVNNKKSKEIIKLLKKKYGDKPICHLKANKDYEFLFAVILSAQCKDERVNSVIKVLYKKYKTLKDFYNANLKDVETIIKPLGFYRVKSKNLINCAKALVDKHNSKVPNDLSELIKLPGVGRKTANVVLGNIFNIPSLAVDTHVNRISNRLFNLNEKDPFKVEIKMKNILDENDLVLWNTHIISFGREICNARNPKCEKCFINKYCYYYNKMIK